MAAADLSSHQHHNRTRHAHTKRARMPREDVAMHNVVVDGEIDRSRVWRSNAAMHSAGNGTQWAESSSRSWLLREGRRCSSRQQKDCEDYDAIGHLFWRQVSGTVLELGGLDGQRSSKTAMFASLGHWRRIIVEGDPSWRASRRQYIASGIPDFAGVTAAVCAKPMAVHYLTKAGGPKEVQGIAEFMSERFVRHWYPELAPHVVWAPQGAGVGWDAAPWATIPHVPLNCLPLTTILQRLGVTHLNMLILDVEGAETEVLRAVDWDTITIDVLAVETTAGTRPPTDRKRVLHHMLNQTGGRYAVWEGHGRIRDRNTWFVRRGFAPNSNPSLAPTVRKLLRNAGNVTYEHERESDLAQFAAQGKEEMHNEATKRTSELAKKIDERRRRMRMRWPAYKAS
ncbi:hypothetical protein EMIHUDRAFT_219950 [Emiliania huxleyi CCMP1516]|uniref:Methyltransferase FkbM domain-containing protein n=2 Tax=Emiliania huxleyi TaxID=2903 RepID=A0A0D3I3J0_EMIH1|nr:hypothetical protein EMIHUDRAFT_219950 [Emiliania huxleyi CCMP1516]EOD05825.1 hypothetical protein EMIHUDRAFT_219950 [Emiliania huxleyi CCMP1516]|eukprot:XP_005758254.1 hypothetical protein EMIHUDRAFT_219950 [Emiliania huxleyi CCMP1516]